MYFINQNLNLFNVQYNTIDTNLNNIYISYIVIHFIHNVSQCRIYPSKSIQPIYTFIHFLFNYKQISLCISYQYASSIYLYFCTSTYLLVSFYSPFFLCTQIIYPSSHTHTHWAYIFSIYPSTHIPSTHTPIIFFYLFLPI